MTGTIGSPKELNKWLNAKKTCLLCSNKTRKRAIFFPGDPRYSGFITPDLRKIGTVILSLCDDHPTCDATAAAVWDKIRQRLGIGGAN